MAREQNYLYIDGGCLRSTVKNLCRDIFDDENAYRPLIQSLTAGFDKIFYYDAVSGKDHGEAQAAYDARVQVEHDKIEEIQAIDRVHVALGKIVGPGKRQKGVDVRLAVDMMTHAFRGITAKATLFAADADFVPLIKALVNEGIHVTLWHPSQANKELRGAADTTRPFGFRENHYCLTSDGRAPAMQVRGFGNLNHLDDELVKIEAGDRLYAGKWDGTHLRIYRSDPIFGWEYADLDMPGADLLMAIYIFDKINEWGLSSAGCDWIKT